jgi:hypothetical protein
LEEEWRFYGDGIHFASPIPSPFARPARGREHSLDLPWDMRPGSNDA